MAKKSKKETAQEYLDSLLAHVPADKRDDVKAALAQDPVLDDLGAHLLRQDEFSRAMDEAREAQRQAEYDKQRYVSTYEKNLDWYKDKQKALEQFDKLQQKGIDINKLITEGTHDGSGGSQALADLTNYVKKDEVAALAQQKAQEILAGREQQYLNFTLTLNDLTMRHLHDYKEPLNTQLLVATAQKTNRPLTEVYKDMTVDLAEQRQKAIEKQQKEALDAEINRRVAEQMSQRAPYPLGTDTEPSTLAGLASKDDIGVEAATRAWLQSQVK